MNLSFDEIAHRNRNSYGYGSGSGYGDGYGDGSGYDTNNRPCFGGFLGYRDWETDRKSVV